MFDCSRNRVGGTVAYGERRHGRKTFTDKNASQISLGDGSYNPFQSPTRDSQDAARHALCTAPSRSAMRDLYGHNGADGRPTRRPRGPGKDFARYIEANGFPVDASRRSAHVDVARETLYHYQLDGLHTHKKVLRMPFRSKQCDDNLQLFIRPEEAQARADAQRQWQWQQRAGHKGGGMSSQGAAPVKRASSQRIPQSWSPADNNRFANAPDEVDQSFCFMHLGDANERQPSIEHAGPLQHRLSLLEELYAREYARLQERSFTSKEEAFEGENTSHGSQGDLPAGASLEQALGHRQAQVSRRHRRVRSAREWPAQSKATVKAASVKPPVDVRQRPLQPWEREYGCEEAAEGPSSLKRTLHSEDESDGVDADVPLEEFDPFSEYSVMNTQPATRDELPSVPSLEMIAGNAVPSEAAERYAVGAYQSHGRQAHSERWHGKPLTRSPTAGPFSLPHTSLHNDDSARQESSARSEVTPLNAAQAQATISPRAWCIPPPRHFPSDPTVRPTLRLDTSPRQKTSPPPIRQQRQQHQGHPCQPHTEEFQHREQCISTPYTLSPPVAQARDPPASFVAAPSTRSLREVDAKRRATALPACCVRANVSRSPVHRPTVAPTKAPRTLRDVCRALQAPL
ncbi:hypothetical protein ABL78_4503 [Leptomonas seymouri]|uniref:Uncharacterized protein n=1 Tax=Leptomonas seymouri TaxID=5684 RepID=A0A0N1IK65_LEPSE|nr:hypothetical protein ABL78_4503 [Leptomonas seymouri]|eukprot:KPI86424.1 hypothetical protein ABL78_4503 [Leptomonas seymouri]